MVCHLMNDKAGEVRSRCTWACNPIDDKRAEMRAGTGIPTRAPRGPGGVAVRRGLCSGSPPPFNSLFYDREPVSFLPLFIEKGKIELETVHVHDGGTGFIQREKKDRMIQRNGPAAGVTGAARDD